mmetsp:Transcript_27699/g.87869  ORF Transcript_27699/g.87869 Transcript_27699/m.87869 type:complete len:192 (-) Transcript_27699:36-611(-)
MFLRGEVATGFGRGSKKLGFPTANLPSSAFAGRLAEVPTGVYSGWAVVEAEAEAAAAAKPPRVYPMVANIGFSPTFEGEENPEKIVEAHLMDYHPGDKDVLDFYGRPLRLLLCARQRPELKFAGFPELVAGITADVHDAGVALAELPTLAALRGHPMLTCAAGEALAALGAEGVNGGQWRRAPLDDYIGEL